MIGIGPWTFQPPKLWKSSPHPYPSDGLSAVLNLSVEHVYNVKSKTGVVLCVESAAGLKYTDRASVNNARKTASFGGARLTAKVTTDEGSETVACSHPSDGGSEPRNLIKISVKKGSNNGHTIAEAKVSVSQLLAGVWGPGKFVVRLSRRVLVEGTVSVHYLENRTEKDYAVSLGSLTHRSVESEYFDEDEIGNMILEIFQKTGKRSSHGAFGAVLSEGSEGTTVYESLLDSEFKSFNATSAQSAQVRETPVASGAAIEADSQTNTALGSRGFNFLKRMVCNLCWSSST